MYPTNKWYAEFEPLSLLCHPEEGSKVLCAAAPNRISLGTLLLSDLLIRMG